jgi:hypothetical protein
LQNQYFQIIFELFALEMRQLAAAFKSRSHKNRSMPCTDSASKLAHSELFAISCYICQKQTILPVLQ